MLKDKRRVTRSFGLLAVLALFAALFPAGAAQADEGGAKFVAQSQVGMVAVTLPAVPAEAATDSVARAATSAVSQQDLRRNQAAGCPAGHQCFYDDSYGNDLLFIAARCGEHDLRGGIYQNKINFVDNYSPAHIYLDIWRNAGYWELYAYVEPWGLERIWTDDIDRIRITC